MRHAETALAHRAAALKRLSKRAVSLKTDECDSELALNDRASPIRT
jgi:hypothetical protein